MRKRFLIIALLLSFYAHSQATFSPGIRGGLNWSTISQLNMNYKSGFYAGAFGNIGLTRFYSLQPELSFSQQGADGAVFREIGYNQNGFPVTAQVGENVDLQYVSFSLMNKFTFMERFGVQVGPVLDFNTSSNVSLNSDLDVGLVFGLFFNVAKGLSVEARIKQGFVDVVDSGLYDEDEDWYLFEEFNANTVFQIGLSYQFDFTAKNAK